MARKEAGESKVIAFNLCGHGHFDMQAYRSFLDGQLKAARLPMAITWLREVLGESAWSASLPKAPTWLLGHSADG